MKHLSGIFITLALILSFFPGVGRAATESDPFITELIAGQHIDVGNVKIWNDSNFIYVQYETVSPWCLNETHVAVASDLADIPQKNGNPIPGQFPYKTTHDCETSFLYKIPLSWSACSLYVAAHAAINSGETAWGSGSAFSGNNWATYIVYEVEGCGVETDTPTPTNTSTPTTTVTATPTNTTTPTFTPTATSTFTPTATFTPTFTPTPTQTNAVCCQPITVYADFSKIAVGASVEGWDTVAPNLKIEAKYDAKKIAVNSGSLAFAAPNDKPVTNLGLAAGGGFSDIEARVKKEAHAYTFTFANGVTVSDFSLHMLDYGDLNTSKSKVHKVSITAYNGGNGVVDMQELSYTSDGKPNPRSSNLFGDLWYSGDGVSAAPGQPGDITWHLSGHGIKAVVLQFVEGFDPNIGFDTLLFTEECPPN